MFGTLGGPELLLILVVALIVFGPRKLPEIGKSMGKMLVEFRRASNDFKRTIETEIETEKASTPTPGALPAGAPGAPATAAAGTPPATPASAPAATPETAPASPEGTVERDPGAPSEPQPKAD